MNRPTSLAFANFAWNILERKFASLVWVAADWSQSLGEFVTADLGNVSITMLFLNIIKDSIDDKSIVEQSELTVNMFGNLRSDRNDLIHCFFFSDPTKNISRHVKVSAKKGSGSLEIKTIAMSKGDIDRMCDDISTCVESVDDLVHKIHFRRQFLAGVNGAFSQTYGQAVHGWRAPSFDIQRLREFQVKRSQRLNPPQGPPQPQSSP
jgi:hypothetical protein